MKVYKIKLNEKVYEVQLEEVSETAGSIQAPAQSAAPVQAAAAPSGVAVNVDAPMPGTIVDVKVKMGDAVAAGQLVAVLEAMKMETEILAPSAGTVGTVHVEKGASVNLGDAIVSLA